MLRPDVGVVLISRNEGSCACSVPFGELEEGAVGSDVLGGVDVAATGSWSTTAFSAFSSEEGAPSDPPVGRTNEEPVSRFALAC